MEDKDLCKQTVVPTLDESTDKCDDCYTDLECVITSSPYEYLNIPEGASMAQIVMAIIDAMSEQSTRITALEEAQD
jgi:hypothetical protein